jgi:hypothetical protein
MYCTETQKLGALVREAGDLAWIGYTSIRALGMRAQSFSIY